VQDGYAFDPEESQFEFQHGISYTDTGTLLVSTEDGGGFGAGSVTMVREYAIGHDTQTLSEVWSYGLKENEDAGLNGSARRLPGNTLHAAGPVRRIRPRPIMACDALQSLEELSISGNPIIP